MKVCDKHQDTQAVDTIVVEQDGTHIDVCSQCKYDVLEMLTKKPEPKSLMQTVKNVFSKS